MNKNICKPIALFPDSYFRITLRVNIRINKSNGVCTFSSRLLRNPWITFGFSRVGMNCQNVLEELRKQFMLLTEICHKYDSCKKINSKIENLKTRKPLTIFREVIKVFVKSESWKNVAKLIRKNHHN